MTEPSDLSIEILKQIRNELVTTRTDLGARVDAVRTGLGARIDAVRTDLGDRIDAVRTELGGRIEAVEGTLLEISEQQRFVVRHLRTLTERDRHIEADVADLRARVEALEGREPPPR